MKTLTLQTAIMLEISNLLFAGAPFSAHNVTQNIRVKVDDEYELSDVEKDEEFDEWVYFTVIEHNQVKVIVHELHENGFIDATNRYNPKGYIEYVPTAIPVPSNVASNTVPIANVSPYYNKIKSYIDNRGMVTIKQIQSALKIRGLTCEDIANALNIDLSKNPHPGISKIPVISNIVGRDLP